MTKSIKFKNGKIKEKWYKQKVTEKVQYFKNQNNQMGGFPGGSVVIIMYVCSIVSNCLRLHGL